MSVIFYSRNCVNCRDLLKRLKEADMLNYFDNFFCIDNRETLPNFLHSVPTIIVSDSDKPLVGDDAFSWLSYKLDQKLKKQELGTLDNSGAANFCDLTKDPNDITLDTVNYISVDNIGQSLKPEMNYNPDSMDVTKQYERIQQERADLLKQQQGPPPPTPNFQ